MTFSGPDGIHNSLSPRPHYFHLPDYSILLSNFVCHPPLNGRRTAAPLAAAAPAVVHSSSTTSLLFINDTSPFSPITRRASRLYTRFRPNAPTICTTTAPHKARTPSRPDIPQEWHTVASRRLLRQWRRPGGLVCVFPHPLCTRHNR